jgi:hypothetical protein
MVKQSRVFWIFDGAKVFINGNITRSLKSLRELELSVLSRIKDKASIASFVSISLEGVSLTVFILFIFEFNKLYF